MTSIGTSRSAPPISDFATLEAWTSSSTPPTGRTGRDADLHLDDVEVTVVEALAGLADGDADGVVGVLDVPYEPRRLHRDQIVGHTSRS